MAPSAYWKSKDGYRRPKRNGVHSRLTSEFSWGNEKEHLTLRRDNGHLLGPE